MEPQLHLVQWGVAPVSRQEPPPFDTGLGLSKAVIGFFLRSVGFSEFLIAFFAPHKIAVHYTVRILIFASISWFQISHLSTKLDKGGFEAQYLMDSTCAL
jgi:hypothetical protein